MAADNPPSESLPLEMIGVDVTSIQAPQSVAMEQVNWKVATGEYWVVGGLPASGQSDLVSTAAGLVRPQAGVHRLFGEEIARLPEAERLRIQLRVGVVFGSGGRLFDEFTVSENLALPLCYHQNCSLLMEQERVQALLRATGLEAVAWTTPGFLNRNLRQRAALARALVLSPALLFLDFPFVGIDTREIRWTLRFLDQLQRGHPLLNRRPMTLVVATDDLQLWDNYPCLYGLVQEKRFMAVGRREELLRRRNEVLPEVLPPGWL
jgi:phospholipid/cholesterol/gamma-HCH transport system ATP-binding protein